MLPHPWFNAPHRRVLTCAFCAIWFAVELWKSPGSVWTVVAGGVTAWTLWDFFLAGHYPVTPPPEN